MDSLPCGLVAQLSRTGVVARNPYRHTGRRRVPDLRVAEGEGLAQGALEGTLRPRHEAQMAGHLLWLASATPPGEPTSSTWTWWVVECAWSEARLRPPAHLVQVDAERAQRVGIRDKPAHHLAEARPASVQRDAEFGQGAHPRRVGLGEDAEQEVLRAEPWVPEGA
jgi:hypothetical protein